MDWLTDSLTDWQTHTEANRQTDWLTETDRPIDRDKMTDWLKDRPTDWQTHPQANRLTAWLTYWQTEKQRDRPIDKDRMTGWLTDRMTDRYTQRQTDRLTNTQTAALHALSPRTCSKGIDNVLKTPMCSSQTALRNLTSCLCAKGRTTKQPNNASPNETAEYWERKDAYLE